METITPPQPSSAQTAARAQVDGRRTGAVWVAATGAFMLVAAAGVFVAVRWNTLSDLAKFGVVAALTAAFLTGGRIVRRTLPATGDVVFHLGAFLLPVDVAAVHVRLGLGWPALLVEEGAAGLVAFTLLAHAADSVVLRWAATAAMVPLAGGVAAETGVPAGLLLAGAALVALVVDRRRVATAWAAMAGLAPMLGALVAMVRSASAMRAGGGVLVDLGLSGHQAALLAMVSGAVAAAVLGLEAHRRRDLGLVVLGFVSLASGVATASTAADLTARDGMLVLPAIFLTIELVAMLVRRDEFWNKPAAVLAGTAEVIGWLGAALTLAIVLVGPIVETGFDIFSDDPGWRPDHAAGVALGLLAAAWVVAGLRRPEPRFRTALVVPLGLAAVGAIEVGTASTIATAVALTGVTIAAGATDRRWLHWLVAAPAAAWAPVVVSISHPHVMPVVGGLGAAGLVLAAVRRHRLEFAAGATALVLLTTINGISDVDRAAALCLGVLGCWFLALGLDRGGLDLGDVARVGMLVAAAGAAVEPGHGGLLALATAAALLGLDAIRLDRPLVAYGAALAVQPLLLQAGEAARLSLAEIGIASCLAAVVWGGVAVLVGERWRNPLVAASALAALVGLTAASVEKDAFGLALMIVGGLFVTAAIVVREPVVGHAGGVAFTIGLALHLAATGVTASEPYLVPVAAQLLAAGLLARRDNGIGSWAAYGPGVALLGGAALVERLSGGDAWHALVAGAVGATAVVAGGGKRLAGPLFLGTALIVATTVHESLATLAGVPTWAWLATGGAGLLAAGIALERSDTSPVDAGRRLVDVIADRFE